MPEATPAAPAAPAAPSPPFAETLPADIRGDAVFRDIKDLAGLAKSYHSAAKMVGMDKARILALPGDDKPESWSPVYQQLGRPEAADKYVLPKRGEGKDYSAEEIAFQKAILPVLHDAGLSQRQVNALVPKWNEIMDNARTAQESATQAEMVKAQDGLKKEWGAAYEQKLGLAHDALVHYADELKLGDEIVRELDASKLGNNPAVAKLLAHLGSQLKEDGILGRNGGGFDAMSPAEAQQQINTRYADKAFMAKYMDRHAPGHAEAVQEMARLFEFKAAASAAAA